MSWYLEAGFSPVKLGNLQVYVDESEAGATDFLVTIATGTFMHTDVTSTGVLYGDFATTLKDALDTGSSRTYTVTWSQSAGTYTISAGANENFVLDFDSAAAQAAGLVVAAGTRMKRVLGFSATGTQPADSQTSDVRPYYYLVGANGCATQQTHDYEEGAADGTYALGGATAAIGPTTVLSRNDFSLTHESEAATYKRAATAAVPWTWQHLWEHIRGDEPFLVVDGTNSTVHYLRAEGTVFHPTPTFPEYDDAWSLRFLTWMEGRL